MITHIHIDPSLIKHSDPNSSNNCALAKAFKRVYPNLKVTAGLTHVCLSMKGHFQRDDTDRSFKIGPKLVSWLDNYVKPVSDPTRKPVPHIEVRILEEKYDKKAVREVEVYLAR